MKYGALRGGRFRLRSSLEASQVRLEQCSLQAFGGDISLRGALQTDAEAGHHPLRAQLRLHQIQLSQLFGLAGAVGFDVLGADNVRGTMNGETDLRTDLDNTFLPDINQTYAFLKTDLQNLELLNVDALMQALRFMREERTSHLYFEPVSPSFVLADGRLLIPDLHLNSNLTDMHISGEYFLNGQADLYVGLSPLQTLFGNNEKRVARIRSGEATQRPSRGLVYVGLSRPAGARRYQVKPFRQPQQRQNQQRVQRQYQHLLRTQQLDTTLRLLR